MICPHIVNWSMMLGAIISWCGGRRGAGDALLCRLSAFKSNQIKPQARCPDVFAPNLGTPAFRPLAPLQGHHVALHQAPGGGLVRARRATLALPPLRAPPTPALPGATALLTQTHAHKLRISHIVGFINLMTMSNST